MSYLIISIMFDTGHKQASKAELVRRFSMKAEREKAIRCQLQRTVQPEMTRRSAISYTLG